ncbi:MAG: tetratricopeptide repeat protein [Aliifodinibius sp.]|nr:tetratricopeptide repeat protein [Fodinibius sp.]NIW96954.1 tetratricopeptide repeat protein [Phycisphaerae bacterium]NIY27118.1 tetratricopeptide repeat protein [Fodinibius sp.]
MNWHWLNLLLIPGLIIGFTVHELGHSLMAYYLGDYSQAKDGKITANPFRHISWFGGALFVLFGIGWPKPVGFNAKNFKNRYLDSFLVATAGPFANFVLCLIIFFSTLLIMGLLNITQQIDKQQVSEIIFFNRTTSPLVSVPFSEAAKDILLWIITFSNRIWVANFVLAFVSLLPLPPFDGFTALLSLIGLMREKRINELTNGDPLPTISFNNTHSVSNSDKKQSMADIHFKVGTEYHEQKKFDDAIARYHQAVKVDATYGPAYVNMGLAYKAKNQRTEAISAFRAATRYAADEKSKNQAWAELHDLSALPGIRSDVYTKNENSGSTPWTDTKPSPDWLTFGVGILVLLLSFVCIFGLLLITLIG